MRIFTAFYDLEHGPISFDFVTWLVRAKKAQLDGGCERLHVVIVPKDDGVGGFSRDWGGYDEHQARWRLWHIIVACCPLAEATFTLAPSRHFADELVTDGGWWSEGKAHFMGPLVEAARRGDAIPKLRATAQAVRYVSAWLASLGETKPLVTLTLRHDSKDLERNSNTKAWAKFAAWLQEQGHRVLWLEDSTLALSLGRGYAELDPDLRLALYEQAAMNVIANNGPQELLKFSAAPFIAMGQALSHGWREHFRKYFGMEPGDQLPWCREDQRLVYEPDAFENLVGAFSAVRREAWATATN